MCQTPVSNDCKQYPCRDPWCPPPPVLGLCVLFLPSYPHNFASLHQQGLSVFQGYQHTCGPLSYPHLRLSYIHHQHQYFFWQTHDGQHHKRFFLGCGGSIKTLIYENLASKLICRASHATLDEADMNTAPTDLTPNLKDFWDALSRSHEVTLIPPYEVLTLPENFFIFSESSPLFVTHVIKAPLKCTFDHMGLILESDPMSHPNMIVDVLDLSSQIDWEHDLCS
jgi:hypothetical protein